MFQPQYSQILTNSIAACRAICDGSKIGLKNCLKLTIFDHTITHVAVSKTEEDSSDAFHVKYIICKCLPNNDKIQLTIAFGETQSMNDFLFFNQLYGEIKGINGNFHFGIHKTSNQIPIEFYVNKILDENYEIVFTGKLYYYTS